MATDIQIQDRYKKLQRLRELKKLRDQKTKARSNFVYEYTLPANGSKEEVLYNERNSVVFKTPIGSGRLMRDIIENEDFNPSPSTTFEQIDANAQKMSANLFFLLAAKDIIPDDAAAKYISERSKAWQNVQARQPETTRAFFDKWNSSGVFGKTAAVFQYPQAVGREIVSQASNAVLPLFASFVGAKGGAAIGAPTGAAVGSIVPGAGTVAGSAAGAVIGGVAGSLTAGYQANKIMGAAETLDEIAVREYGVNPADAESVLEFLTNPDKVESAQKRAVAAGADMAAVETITQIMTFGIAKWTKGMKLSGRLAGAGSSVALEAGGETGGEAARQYSAFKDVDWNEALFEGVASLGQSAGTTAINYGIVGAQAAAQQAKSVVFKADQAISQADEQGSIESINGIEQDLNQAYEAAVYDRGESEIETLNVPPQEPLPDIKFAENINEVFENEQVQNLDMPKRPSYLKTFAEDFGLGVKKAVTPISTRIKAISPELFTRMRKYEFSVKKSVLQDIAEALPMMQKMKALPENARVGLDLAMKNRDIERINKIAGQYNIQKEVDAVRPMLDAVFKRAEAAGIKMNYLENHFPRQIKNLNGLMDHLKKKKGYWSVIREALKAKESKLDRALTKEEQAAVIDNLLLGRKVEGISLAKKGVFKERTIQEITPDIDQYYASTTESLLHYIHTANEAIETNLLFGRGDKTQEGFQVNYEKSIGETVSEMVDNDQITNAQSSELKDMLQARFNPGRMSRGVGAFRDLAYIDVMGSPLNAITQFGDLAPSIYNAGLMEVAKTLPSAVRDSTMINLKDIGIEDIAIEFDNNGWSSALVDKVFAATGLQKIDRIGKLTLVNSTFKKQMKQADAGDPKLMADLQLYFGDQAERVRQALVDGDITEDVKFLAFNTLLDVQPVARSEMPEYYLRSGSTGKLMYMLKSFTIKQIDFYNKVSFGLVKDGIKNKDPKKVAAGLRNFAYLYALWVMSNAGADALKDLVKSMFGGDELEDIDDYIIEGMYKGFGFNKYSFDMMNRGFMPDDPGDFVFNFILPPKKLIENAWRDYQTVQKKDNIEPKDLRSIRSIPIGGELYWFWFGGGSKDDKKFETKSNY